MMGVPTLIGLTIASAVVSAGASAYQTQEQARIADEEASRVKQAEADRKKEAERIAAETRPDGETAKSAKFGKDTGTKDLGSTKDFKVDKKSTGLSAVGASGLGF